MADDDTKLYRISIEPFEKPTFTPIDLVTGTATARQMAEDAWQERIVDGKSTVTIAIIDVDTNKVADVYDGKEWWSQQKDYDGD
jgi:hypothetical protein